MTELLTDPLLAAAVSLAVKSTFILCAAALGAFLLGRMGASAAARHLNWLAAILALLVLPLLVAGLPPLNLPLLPRQETAVEVVRPTAGAALAAPASTLATSRTEVSADGPQSPKETAPLSETSAAPPVAADASTGTRSFPSPPTLLYLAIALGLLLRLAVAQLILLFLPKRAWAVTDPAWGSMIRTLSSDLRVRPRIRLFIDPASSMPITWGTLRPSILLPAEALSWTHERRRFVLLHEMAHIKRRDTLTQTAAALACTLFWWHPLAWYAAGQMRKEQEHACDDLVLSLLGKPRTYARNLLELARGLEPTPLVAGLSVAIARQSDMEARLLAIIDRVRDRRPADARLATRVGLIMVSLTLVVAAVNPVRGASESPATEGPGSGASTINRTVPAVPGGVLSVDLGTGGEVSISGWDRSEVHLEAVLRGRDRAGTRVELQRIGAANVRLSARQSSSGRYSTSHRFVLRVPHRYSVIVASGGGGIRLSGLTGRFSGTTDGGSLVLAGLKGEVSLATRGGDVDVRDSSLSGSVSTRGGAVRFSNVSGPLRALKDGRPAGPVRTAAGAPLSIDQRGGDIDIDSAENGARLVTGGGNIRLRSANIFVDAQTGAGDIFLGHVEGAVTAVTGKGAATVELAGVGPGPARDVVIRSGSGPVTIVLWAGVGAEFDVETGYTAAFGRPARIIADMPLRTTESSTFEAVERGTPRRFIRGAGRVGDGRYRIKIRTVNGDVRIVRRDAAETLAPPNPGSLPSAAARWTVEQERERSIEQAAATKAVVSLERTLWGAATSRAQTEAVESLAWLEGGAGLPALERAARDHPSPAVRAAAIFELGRVADDEAVAALGRAAFSDPDAGVQADAVRALASGSARDDRARRSALRQLSRIAAAHPSLLVMSRAAEELRNIPSPGA